MNLTDLQVNLYLNLIFVIMIFVLV